MTEKEKMLAGMLYSGFGNDELSDELSKAKDLCLKYNNIPFSHNKEREELIKEILGKSGKKICITAPFWCDYGSNTEVGDYFYSNHNLVILDCAKVKFGNNVFIGPNCGFYAAGHPIVSEERNSGIEYAYQITVGDNVWFGGSVCVLPGVTIGSDVVIGAGSVVNKDIPSGVVAAGNPCKVIRKITDDDKMIK